MWNKEIRNQKDILGGKHMRIKYRISKLGLVEIFQKGDMYSLVVDGVIKQQCRDLGYILGVYDKY